MSLADVAEIVDTSLVNGHLTSLTFVALSTKTPNPVITNSAVGMSKPLWDECMSVNPFYLFPPFGSSSLIDAPVFSFTELSWLRRWTFKYMQQELSLLVVLVQSDGLIPLPRGVHTNGVSIDVQPLHVEGCLGLEGTLHSQLLPHLFQWGAGVKVKSGLSSDR